MLHPYYKLDYIEMAWGGADEQKKEIKDGNPHAKNWQDEAQKVVEGAVILGLPYRVCCAMFGCFPYIPAAILLLSSLFLPLSSILLRYP